MNVNELFARSPEIPADLAEEPLLARFADGLDSLLRTAVKPSPCSQGHEAANHYYLKLIGPLAIYGYGLATREHVMQQVAALLERHAADRAGFVASLLPADIALPETK